MKKNKKVILTAKYIKESEKSDYNIKKEKHISQQINYYMKLKKTIKFIIYSKLKNYYEIKESNSIIDKNILKKINLVTRYL